MKKILFTIATLIFLNCYTSAQNYDYGLDVCEKDARIQGKLNLSDGSNSVFIGESAGINDEGNTANTFVGVNSGQSNTSGILNTFLGIGSGRLNASGLSNTFLGAHAGNANKTGGSNTFIGAGSGDSNIDGAENVFIGKLAGKENVSGHASTFIGKDSGLNNTTGIGNVFLGWFAGGFNQSGSNNTFLGYHAGPISSASTALDKTMALGYNARVDCNNCAVIGGTGIDAVKLGVGTTNPTYDLHLVGDAGKSIGGSDWIVISDKRLKKDIRPYKGGLKEILKINPVKFKYTGEAGTDNSDNDYIGVIAQEIGQIAPYTIKPYHYKESYIENKSDKSVKKRTVTSKEYLSLDASSVRWMLVNAVKTLSDEHKEKDDRIEQLESDVRELKKLLKEVLTKGKLNTQTELINNARLGQNMPNPFNNNTSIPYIIPSNSQSASIQLHNINGQLIKTIVINTFGEGTIDLHTQHLGNGQYTYTLEVDGRIIDTKKMNLIK